MTQPYCGKCGVNITGGFFCSKCLPELRKEPFNARCIRVEGAKPQEDYMIEECAELIQAIQKYKRDPSAVRRANIIEELADVQITLDIMKDLYGVQAVEYQVVLKIERTQKYLDGVEK